jgi:hypothetical protein
VPRADNSGASGSASPTTNSGFNWALIVALNNAIKKIKRMVLIDTGIFIFY